MHFGNYCPCGRVDFIKCAGTLCGLRLVLQKGINLVHSFGFAHFKISWGFIAVFLHLAGC